LKFKVRAPWRRATRREEYNSRELEAMEWCLASRYEVFSPQLIARNTRLSIAEAEGLIKKVFKFNQLAKEGKR
jgi:hypothetical protein